MNFGTDGIRSTDIDLLCTAGYQLGKAQQGKSKVVLAEDNRPTSRRIAKAVAGGLYAAGVDILYGGVMTTPAVQYATKYLTADAGIVVTASHNVAKYNGLKYVDADGRKPSRDELEALSAALDDGAPYREGELPAVSDNLSKVYTEKFRHFGEIPLHIAVDCANGAAYPTIKRVFGQHKIEGVYLHHGDGKQINRDCGALHPEGLLQHKDVDMAFALDGDGDRCILVTANGRVVDGDGMLYLLAAYYTQKRVDVGGAIASTILANGALSTALSQLGLRLVRTDVGDSVVAQAMRRNKLAIGGEPSGHILLDGEVADGIYTALTIAQVALEYDLDALLAPYHPLPQYHTKVRLSEDVLRRAKTAAGKWQDYLADTGRVVVRPSGTEPIVRIMVECASRTLAQTIGDSIAQAAVTK